MRQTCTNDHFVTAKENRQEIDPANGAQIIKF
jgi:hypothetical protein